MKRKAWKLLVLLTKFTMLF